jgi:hypothetical protein
MMQYGIIYSILIAVLANLKNIDAGTIETFISRVSGNSTAEVNGSSGGLLVQTYNTSKYIITIGIVLVALAYVCLRLWNMFKKKVETNKKGRDFYTIEFHTPDAVKSVINYINMFPDIFGAEFDSSRGNLDLEFYFQKNYEQARQKGLENSELAFIRKLRDLFIPKFDTHLPFEIEDIGLAGRMHMTNNTKAYTIVSEDKSNKKIEESKSVFLISVVLEITKNDQNLSNEDIRTYMVEEVYYKERECNTIHLKHQKSYYEGGGRGVYEEKFFKGQKDTVENLEKIWIDPFFHPEKDRLWGLVKTIHCNPETLIQMGQSPRANFLLHGPPGTGKSSFPFRVAMTLQYDICSLDVRHFDSKTQFEEVIRNCSNMGTSGHHKKIVIFDEFDIGIRHLYRMEETSNLEREHLQKQVEHTYKRLESLDTDYDSFVNDEFNKIEGKNKKDSDSDEDSKKEEEDESEDDEESDKDESAEEDKKDIREDKPKSSKKKTKESLKKSDKKDKKKKTKGKGVHALSDTDDDFMFYEGANGVYTYSAHVKGKLI